MLGDALSTDKRAFLRDLLERNATAAGAQRIRAGIPPGWAVADKTGTGYYGTINDVAVGWSPTSAPLIIAILSSKAAKNAEYDEKLIIEATSYIVPLSRRRVLNGGFLSQAD